MIRRIMTCRLSRTARFPAAAALAVLAALAAAAPPPVKPGVPAAPAVRARDLGIPFDGTPGPLDAITDVAGVTVGHATIDAGDVHTGVTAVLPRGSGGENDPVFAAWFAQNGNGEMTGTTWVEESGFLEGPVMITNTHSVGVVRDAVIRWRLAHGGPDADGYSWSLPVVGETWDGWLNDVNGFHVTAEHAFAALDSAHGGPVAEGSVGGGTGMICNGYKGGIGTASRRLDDRSGGYTVGVLVQCNYGTRQNLRIAGIPVGREIPAPEPYAFMPSDLAERGSIIVVVATDAPLLAHQLRRVAHRVTLALGRTGSISGDGSGDIFIAFSTANPGAAASGRPVQLAMLPNDALDPVFGATVEATEEAIVNAMIAARDMTGIHGHRVIALPHAALQDVLRRHNRLVQ
jgi:L-aminopeptidase/D-esterase-like protein